MDLGEQGRSWVERSEGWSRGKGLGLGGGSGVDCGHLFISGRLFLAEFSSFLSPLFRLRLSASGFRSLNVSIVVFTAT
jgi:hypothetical protein